MDDKKIKKEYNRFFKDNLEISAKMMAVFDKNRCHIGCADSPELLFYPFICQLWEGRDSTIIEEDLMCAYVWQKIITNKISYRVQETPRCFKDDNIKENRLLVKSYVTNCLDSGIENADFWGGTQGEDGFIKFNEPSIFGNSHFPLEIGYIKPTQFIYHLMYRKCIARLPYDSDYIVYFESLESGF